MKSAWQFKPLETIAEITNGFAFKSTDFSEEGFTKCIKITNVGVNEFIAESDQFLPENFSNTYEFASVNKNDIVIALTRAIIKNGLKVAVVPNEYHMALLNQRVASIRTKPDEIVSSFLFAYLSTESVIEYVTERVNTLMQPNLSVKDLRSLPIPVPPIHEQHRIVAILDEAFDGIATAKANAEKNWQNARALFESHLQAVFSQRGDGWGVKTIKEITSLLGDGLHGTPKYTDDGEYYFVNGNNLDNGKIVFKESTKRVSVTEYEKHKKRLSDRTVLVSINGTLGNVAFYNDEKIILGKSACYFNLMDDVNKHFIKYIISSPYFLEYAHREATGATIKNVSLKSMREFKVPLPSLAEQKEIVCNLDSLSKETQRLESIYQQKLATLDELKKSLLHQAFSGSL